MNDKSITLERRKTVYAEGKRAFDEHKQRAHNPYAANNLKLAVSWWHGWDTAEEECTSPAAAFEGLARIVE
jgi:hypothetical protein